MAVLPRLVRPMLATLRRGLPADQDRYGWEFKWDGMRAIAYVSCEQVRLVSRNDKEMAGSYPELAVLAARVRAPVILDGEIVALRRGRPDLGALQSRMHLRHPPARLIEAAPVQLYLFDLLHHGPDSLLGLPYTARRARLEDLGLDADPVRTPPWFRDDAQAVLAASREHGLEGAVGKPLASRYHPGRRLDWIKVKNIRHQEVIIGGWAPGRGSRANTIGSLLLGVYDDGRLRYAGNVGTGFTEAMLAGLIGQLSALRRETSPFSTPVPARYARGAHWVQPRLAGEVRFTEWTADGSMRHPSWHGLRADNNPEDGHRGRTSEEVKADPRRVWRLDLPPAQASVPIDGTVATARPSDDELDALGSLGSGGNWEVFGRQLRLTNLDKVLFPAADGQPPVTKREFIRYAACMACVALPYLAGRALNMHRFPGGADTPGFWHKQPPGHAPDWISRWDNPGAEPGKTRTYLVVNEPATLVWAANFGALEWHAWTSCTDQPHLPTYALIDIDPGPATSWDDVLALARLHRIALQHLGVSGRPKLTGRRGIQIWIPIARGPSFDDTRSWTRQLSRAVGAAVPDLVSWEWNVRDRGGKARLDYTQNAGNKTLVAPYSPRAAAAAPVSTPIDWEELDNPSLRPGSFTIRDFPRRLAERGDPFRTVLTAHQVLPPIT
jgi:DNA ligase D